MDILGGFGMRMGLFRVSLLPLQIDTQRVDCSVAAPTSYRVASSFKGPAGVWDGMHAKHKSLSARLQTHPANRQHIDAEWHVCRVGDLVGAATYDLLVPLAKLTYIPQHPQLV